MNQLAARSTPATAPLAAVGGTGVGISPLGTPTGSVNASPAKTAAASVVVQPLTDVFVPLESIQPATATPLNPFDKHNVKVGDYLFLHPSSTRFKRPAVTDIC